MPPWAINTFSRSGSSIRAWRRPANILVNNWIDVDNVVNKKIEKFVFYLFMLYLCRSYGSMPKRACCFTVSF